MTRLLTEVPFIFPTKQRVLTKQEYEALGYVETSQARELNGFRARNDKPLKKQIFPAYRADTKEQFAIDYATGIVKVGYTIATGGALPAAKTALGYTWSILS